MAFDKEQCRQDLEVDVHNLSEQWAEQPTLFLNYALELSILIKERSIARGKLTDKITANPGKYGFTPDKSGLVKISEAGMERVIVMDMTIINLTYEIDNFNWSVKAFEHRKKALEYESQFLMGGFHAEPKERKPLKKKKRKT